MGADQRAGGAGLPDDPEALEAIIDARRRHLAQTVDELAVRAHPKEIARRTTADAKQRAVGRRLAWAGVVAVGQHVRQVQVGDRVLYDPEDRAEVELHGAPYVLLRERDLHAVAASRVEDGQTGLYL